MRCPSRVTLPFGYRVTVKLGSDDELDALDADAYWDSSTRTIVIRKKLPSARKVYLLTHEFGHAFLDWQHLHLDEEHAKP